MALKTSCHFLIFWLWAAWEWLFKIGYIFEHDFITLIKIKVAFKVWSKTVRYTWSTDTVQVSSLLMFFSLSLTYYGSFAQPLFISPPSWHHTILQARGVGTHTELSRQVAVQAAGCAWRRQAGWLAGRSWLVCLVPPHWLCHLGSVSAGGGTDGQETWGVIERVKEKSRLWHLIQQMDRVKIELESSSRVKELKITTPSTHKC